jgi:hypothetical protein
MAASATALACQRPSCVQFGTIAAGHRAGGHVSAATKDSDTADDRPVESSLRSASEPHAPAPQLPTPAEGGAPTAPGSVPLGQRGQIYTMTAQEGLDAAELVNAAFAQKLIGARTPRRVEVVAPDGPSTAGGKRARQTIRLVRARGEGPPIMCGYLDVARKVVELRSYSSVLQQYEERFAERFDVTESEYATLCNDLEATLKIFRYTFAYESTPPAAAHAARAQQKASAEDTGINPLRLNLTLVSLAFVIVAGVAAAIALR